MIDEDGSTHTKVVHIQLSASRRLSVTISERLSESPLFVWPAAFVLACYLASSGEATGRTVLEIGAGVGLPSLVAGLCGARRVVLTDRPDEPLTSALMRRNVRLNALEHVCAVEDLSWDGELPHSLAHSLDLVLGADVLYSERTCLDALGFFARALQLRPSLTLLTAYQERNASRSIQPHMQLFGLAAEVVPLRSFLNRCHWEGLCALKSSDGSKRRTLELRSFENVFLLRITSAALRKTTEDVAC